jgi:polyferredoxin
MVSMAKPNRPKKKSWISLIRLVVQAAFVLVWVNPWLRVHQFCSPVFHCHSCPAALLACPIGVLANFSAYHVMPFVALGTLFASGAVFGSFVCGWACPFGFLQDLVARIPTPKLTLPRWTGVFRYAVLVGLVLVIPWFFGKGTRDPSEAAAAAAGNEAATAESAGFSASDLFFCKVCPAGALEAALPNTASQIATGQEVTWPNPVKLSILAVVLVSMLFIWRPWCTVLCPLGAIFAVCNKFSLLYLRFHSDRCVGCASCRSACEDGTRAGERIDGLRCVRCAECLNCNPVSFATVFTPEPEGSCPPCDGKGQS